MASLTIRNLDSALKDRLRVRAAQRGRSMEAEVRHILQDALGRKAGASNQRLSERIHRRFAALGGVDLELPVRSSAREPPQFE